MKRILFKWLEGKINCPWLSSPIPSLQVGHYGIICPYYTYTHTHIPTFSIWGLSFIMLKISFSELYETQHLFPNKLINVPCGALQYLFARGGLSVFENNYKNELQMVLLSRYNRCYFGLTNMNCGREKSDTHKAEQSIYSVICVFFSGLFKYHTLNSREREKINKPLWTGKQAAEHINAVLGVISSNYSSI